jgi:hypothetical protein
MNNTSVQTFLLDCWQDIESIRKEIKSLTATDRKISYFTQYVLIRSCGTIELCYKTIFADFAFKTSCPRTRSFLEHKILRSSSNPSLHNIENLLGQFDDKWKKDFSNCINLHLDKSRLTGSLSSLNKLRNNFAHGQNITASFEDIRIYFADAWRIIRMLDIIVH